MGSFLQAHGGTMLVGLVVIAAGAAAIIKIYRDKKKGKSGCGCGCGHCASSELCHKR